MGGRRAPILPFRSSEERHFFLFRFDVGQDGVAYLSDGSNLYTVNLTTGVATAAGMIGQAGVATIAAFVPEPGSALIAAAGLMVVSLHRRRT